MFSKENNWHDFDDIEDDYVMLDPIKLTFTTPGLNDDGTMADTGIPASVVTNFLIDYNIVCEKTDYYSFLLLNSLGTDRAKQGALLTALYKFKQCYDANRPLREVMPEMVKAYPEAYAGVGLKDHCQALHDYLTLRQNFENLFPGYESDIHGVEREARGGKKHFKTLCVKEG